MAKELITADNVEQFVCDGKLCMNGSRILTPGARDVLGKKHVEVVYGEAPCNNTACRNPCGNAAWQGSSSPVAAGQCTSGACNAEFDEDVLVGVAAIIKRHYNITNPEELRRVTLTTVRAIAGNKK